MLSILILTFVVAGFKNTGPESKLTPGIRESEVLVKYLESTDSPLGKDFINTDMPTIISATEVNSLNLTHQVYIIDIRPAADFAEGHIPNAVNVNFPDILDHIRAVDLTNYTKVAIVCHTGQTAGYAACLLRLLGYNKVYSMKWGMCSWNQEFSDKWNKALSNMYITQFTNVATEKGPVNTLPVLSTGKKTGREILEARVNTLLSEGFDPAKITKTILFNNLASYYIMN